MSTQIRRVYNQIGKKRREAYALLLEPGAIARKLSHLFDPSTADQAPFPKNWIVNQRYKFLYCPIPKAASSSMLRLVLLLSDSDKKEKILEQDSKLIRTYVATHLQTSQLKLERQQQIFADKDYFTFTVVRNPWSRLVSAYLDKFVLNKGTAISSTRKIEKAVYQQLNLPTDHQKSVTFRQFLHYIERTADADLNPHWRPQHTFLSGFDFDFVGHLETLQTDFSYIQNRLGIEFDLPYALIRRSAYLDSSENDIAYADWSPAQLSQLDKFPTYQCFYDQAMVETVKVRYRGDIEQFSYSFE